MLLIQYVKSYFSDEFLAALKIGWIEVAVAENQNEAYYYLAAGLAVIDTSSRVLMAYIRVQYAHLTNRLSFHC
jgi:hypothetical protein